MSFKMASLNVIKGWRESDVLIFLEQNNLSDYKTFASAKEIDGFKLLSLSEGIIALWRPKLDPKKLMTTIDDLKNNPSRYFLQNKLQINQSKKGIASVEPTNSNKSIEALQKKIKPKVPERRDSLKEYKKVILKDTEDKNSNLNENKSIVLKRISFSKMVAPQSFLYSKTLKKVATKVNPYAPMDNSIIEQNQNNSQEMSSSKIDDIIRDTNLSTIINDRGYYEMNLMRNTYIDNHKKKNEIHITHKSKTKKKDSGFVENISYDNMTNDRRYYEMSLQNSEEKIESNSMSRYKTKESNEDINYTTNTNDKSYYEMSLPTKSSNGKDKMINSIKIIEHQNKKNPDDPNHNKNNEITLTSKNMNENQYLDDNEGSDENLYEELVIFPNKTDDVTVDGTNKKKVGILKRVLRKPILKRDKKEDISTTFTDQEEIVGEKTADTNNFQRLQMINERVTKRLYPSQANNYNVNTTTTSVTSINKDKYEKIPEFKLSEELLELGYSYFPYILEGHDKKNENNQSNCILSGGEQEKTHPTLFVENDIEFYEEPPNSLPSDAFFNLDLRLINENFYESADHVGKDDFFKAEKNHVYDEPTIDVEDYLEPRQITSFKEENIMDTLAEEIFNLFNASAESINMESDATSATFQKDAQMSAETTEMASNECKNETNPPEIIQKPPTPKKPLYLPKPLPRKKLPSYPDVNTKKNLSKFGDDSSKPMLSFSANNMHTISLTPKTPTSINLSQSIDQFDDVASRPFETLQKWNETLRNSLKKKRDVKRNMAERPLPVPVENEFYYMDVSRKDAESLLEGHADGTFILRPSSQSLHAYTVTLIYQEHIYNIGCRRRQDGRLALGFSKASEQSFLTINELIEHYYHEKLVLLVDGMKVGSTVLKKLNA